MIVKQQKKTLGIDALAQNQYLIRHNHVLQKKFHSFSRNISGGRGRGVEERLSSKVAKWREILQKAVAI